MSRVLKLSNTRNYVKALKTTYGRDNVTVGDSVRVVIDTYGELYIPEECSAPSHIDEMTSAVYSWIRANITADKSNILPWLKENSEASNYGPHELFDIYENCVHSNPGQIEEIYARSSIKGKYDGRILLEWFAGWRAPNELVNRVLGNPETWKDISFLDKLKITAHKSLVDMLTIARIPVQYLKHPPINRIARSYVVEYCGNDAVLCAAPPTGPLNWRLFDYDAARAKMDEYFNELGE